MESLLFLCHRIPYPPNKGDKIRSFHFLRHLALHYRIYLGTFIDDPTDEAWRTKLREYCIDCCVVSIDPRWRKLLCLRGFLTGEPLGLPYYRDAGLRVWVDQVLRDVKPARVLVFSSTMAQYLPAESYAQARTVVDFVDVDSEKWRAYADRQSWPLNAVYRREARLLRTYEEKIARRAAAAVFVSEPEAMLFSSLLGTPSSTVCHVDNGVDLDFFHPDANLPSPYNPAAEVCVFTGAMDYWANIDAVTWFADEVWPRLRELHRDVEFWIVGSNPAVEVRNLGRRPGIHVTGSVPDVRPYVQHASVVVAPLRIARGIQNKVLEGMAMNKPVVGTPEAFEGIRVTQDAFLRICNGAAEFATATHEVLATHAGTNLPGPRRFVEGNHDWGANLRRLHELVEG